jgi:electron transfer flavoprotein alpha subunit
MSGIWVVLEEREGRIGRISWEAVVAGQKLAALTGLAANAVVIGAQTEALAAEVAAKAVGKVVRVEHPLLAAYTADGFTLALQQFIEKESVPRMWYFRTPTRCATTPLRWRLGWARCSSAT